MVSAEACLPAGTLLQGCSRVVCGSNRAFVNAAHHCWSIHPVLHDQLWLPPLVATCKVHTHVFVTDTGWSTTVCLGEFCEAGEEGVVWYSRR